MAKGSQKTGASRRHVPHAPSASIAPSGLSRYRRWAAVLGGIAIIVVIAAVGYAGLSGNSGSTGSAEQGRGGAWTNVSADTLAGMLEHKDFTLVDVKTPYIGEIEGTDLYIPYTDVAARAAELPADRAAKILVYCRAGNESRVAAQALLDLGYTNVWNLDGGMESWVASGRTLIQKART